HCPYVFRALRLQPQVFLIRVVGLQNEIPVVHGFIAIDDRRNVTKRSTSANYERIALIEEIGRNIVHTQMSRLTLNIHVTIKDLSCGVTSHNPNDYAEDCGIAWGLIHPLKSSVGKANLDSLTEK